MSAETLLVLQEGAETHRLYLESVVLGRSSACDLSFDTQGVSRRHCEVVLRPDGVLVRDLGSTHGTFVDGHRVGGELLVVVGTVLRLGPRGPRLRVLDARLGGRRLGVDVGRGERAATAARRRDPPRTTPAAPPRGPDRPTATPATPTEPATGPVTLPATGRRKALLVGGALGVLLGLAILVVVDTEPWLAAVRAALGVR